MTIFSTDSLLSIILTVLSFLFFFFGVPYSTGNEMSTIAKNGVYRLVYTKCSGVGWLVYKLVERINSFIDRLLKIKEGSFWHTLLNALLYVGVVAASTALYENSMSRIIGGEVGEIKINGGSSYAILSDMILFYEIITNFEEVTSVGTFFLALKNSLFNIVIFVIVTLFFFSVMYGMLAHKVKEVGFIEKLAGNSKAAKLLDYEPEKQTLRTLPKQLASNVLNFLNGVVLLRNFKNRGVQIAFSIMLALYGILKVIFGKSLDLGEFALNLLDETDILNVLVSFIVSVISAKIAALLGKTVYKVLPESVQNKLKAASVECGKAVQAIKEKRKVWSMRFDSIYQKTSNKIEWENNSDSVTKIKLDQNSEE